MRSSTKRIVVKSIPRIRRAVGGRLFLLSFLQTGIEQVVQGVRVRSLFLALLFGIGLFRLRRCLETLWITDVFLRMLYRECVQTERNSESECVIITKRGIHKNMIRIVHSEKEGSIPKKLSEGSIAAK